MMTKMNDYLKRKIQFKLIDFYTQLAQDKLYKMSETLLLLQKDNLTDLEFKEFILCIEQELQKKYTTQRMPILSKLYYILKVTAKIKDEVVTLPDDV